LSGMLFPVILLHFASLLFELQRECKLTGVAKENIPLMIRIYFRALVFDLYLLL
jgi:hypothetical protein